MFSFKSFVLFFIIFLLVFISIEKSYSQNKIRVGIYDSRFIAVAYYNSKYFKLMPEVTQKMKTAKEKNDTTEMSNINKEMSLRQRFIHEQGFGKGSVCYIIEEMKDKISELAKNEKLNIIVSKWELNFKGSNVEIIDITEKIANLYEPTNNIKEMIKDFNNNEPVKEAFLLDD